MIRNTLNFMMYEWLDTEDLFLRDRYAEHSPGTINAVLDLSERIASQCFAPFNRRADVEEPVFDGIKVHLPSSTKDAVDAYAESGLLAAGHDYDVGGMQLPFVVDMAANAFFYMGSISIAAFGMLTYANANLLMAYGTEHQRAAFALPQLEGRYLGTMCLSEVQAGSSLGDIATIANPDGHDFNSDPLGPRYRIKGSKMWISGGEHELRHNIIHLVLAKIPDANGSVVAGTKGISLFVVPRLLLEGSGQPSGARNDVALAGLNHKLGYRGIPNTVLNFGEGRFPVPSTGGLDGAGSGAIGYLVGEPGQGLHLMFHMMNEARINVGMGATMLGYAGYQKALSYARERRQGRMANHKGTDADVLAPVAIIEHVDVKRMLLAQKAFCEGGLLLGLFCARLVDEVRTGDVTRAREASLLLDVLTPVAKSWPSEWCLEANSLAIQVHGGYGYTRDFDVEQLWRDNRLNMIHEGTNGIQSLDLLGRKVIGDHGEALEVVASRMRATIHRAGDDDELSIYAEKLERAVEVVLVATRQAWAEGSRAQAVINSMAYLNAFGHTVLSWLWLDAAISARQNPPRSGSLDQPGRRGLIQAMRYFFSHELPKVANWAALVSCRDTTCSDMADTMF